MTTYRLPDGAEVRPADSNLLKVQTLANHTWVIHPTLGAISCYTGLLTEVEPPLPPVPDVLAVAIGDHVFCRDDDLDGPFFACPGAPVCHKRTYDWAELNELAREEGKPVIPLVPDPADDAPELPWTLKTHGWNLTVYRPKPEGTIQLTLGETYEDFGIDDAERIAVAILGGVRASREVDQP